MEHTLPMVKYYLLMCSKNHARQKAVKVSLKKKKVGYKT